MGGVSTPATRRAAKLRRDRAVVRAYQAGQTLDQVAAAFHLSPSGVSRILGRMGARPSHMQFCLRRRQSGAGRKPIWPDCPQELRGEYLRIRVIIGSCAARDQLRAISHRASMGGR